MSGSPDRARWTCPQCKRLFTIPAGVAITLCPECKKTNEDRRALAPALPRHSTDWYVQLKYEPEPRGPLPIRALQRLYRQGIMTQEDIAWRGASGDKLEVSSFPEIWSQQSAPPIHVYSTPTIERPGCLITEHLPVVFSRRVYGINYFADLSGAVADITGGRVVRYEKATEDIERELLDDLRHAADAHGGNAIVNFRMQFGEFSGKDKFMLWGIAQGTPVVVTALSE